MAVNVKVLLFDVELNPSITLGHTIKVVVVLLLVPQASVAVRVTV